MLDDIFKDFIAGSILVSSPSQDPDIPVGAVHVAPAQRRRLQIGPRAFEPIPRASLAFSGGFCYIENL